MSTITLSDLLGDEEFVETSHGRLGVRGLNAGELLKLMRLYPVLQESQTGQGAALNIEAMVAAAPQAIPVMISLACDMPGRQGERAAMRLSAADQLAVLTASLRLSMPSGPGDFLERLAELMQTISSE